jgi:hypothetical protein
MSPLWALSGRLGRRTGVALRMVLFGGASFKITSQRPRRPRTGGVQRSATNRVSFSAGRAMLGAPGRAAFRCEAFYQVTPRSKSRLSGRDGRGPGWAGRLRQIGSRFSRAERCSALRAGGLSLRGVLPGDTSFKITSQRPRRPRTGGCAALGDESGLVFRGPSDARRSRQGGLAWRSVSVRWCPVRNHISAAGTSADRGAPASAPSSILVLIRVHLCLSVVKISPRSCQFVKFVSLRFRFSLLFYHGEVRR